MKFGSNRQRNTFECKWQGHSVTHPLFSILWLAKVMIIQKKAMNQIWKFKNKTLLHFGFLATGIDHKSLVIWNFVSGNLPTVDHLFHEKPFVLVEIIFFRSNLLKIVPKKKSSDYHQPHKYLGKSQCLGWASTYACTMVKPLIFWVLSKHDKYSVLKT
jgi:hypothetical protein